MTWIRRSELHDLEFQPLTKDSKRKTDVWDNENKTFIKEGEDLTLANGTTIKIDQWIGNELKREGSTEDKARYRASMGFIREIIVGSEKHMVSLPYSVENKLQKLMSREKNPLDFTYTIDKEGEGLKTQYDVFKGDQVGAVDAPQGGITPPPKGEVKTCNGVDLTQPQIDIIIEYQKWIFTGNHDITNKQIEAEVVVGLMENGMTESMAKDIIEEHLK